MSKIVSVTRWTAGLVLLSFAWVALVPAMDMPLGAAAGAPSDSVQAGRPAKNDSGVLEKAGTGPSMAQRKKFPWFWAVAGVAAVGVAVYFIFFHEPGQTLDIRGKWRIVFFHGTFSMDAVFSGTLTAGTVSVVAGFLAGEAGTYQVSDDQVAFRIPLKTAYYAYNFQGRFDTADALSGTYFVETDPPGTPADFSAVRLE